MYPIVTILASPSFWWVYVAVAWFFREMFPGLMHMGSDKHIVVDNIQNRKVVAIKWVKRGKVSWGKLKGRFSQSEATMFTEPGFLSEHGVQLTTLEKSLPLGATFEEMPIQVKLEEVPHNPVGTYSKTKDGKVKFTQGAKFSINPNVKAIEELLGREMAKQLHTLNSMTGNLGIVLIIVIAGVGFTIGLLGSPYIMPHVYPAAQAVPSAVAKP